MRCILGVKECSPNIYSCQYDPYSFFIGYQVSSEYYQTTALLAMGKRIMDLLNSDDSFYLLLSTYIFIVNYKEGKLWCDVFIRN